MDTLSRLIDLARPQASLDLRCLFAGPFTVDHTPEEPGIAPFHLVLDGACSIETPAARTPLSLRAGDFVLFPRGAAHRVRERRAGSNERESSEHTTQPLTLTHDGMLPVRRNGEPAEHVDLDLLCGRFIYTSGPAALLLDSLPDPLHVSLADALPGVFVGGEPTADLSGAASAGHALRMLTTLMRGEAEQRAPGALAIVTALSHALLALALRAHGANGANGSNGGSPMQSGVLTLLSDPRLRGSVEAMLNAPERAWTLAELGDVAAMSRATYARHFSERAGMTPMDFLTQLRMAIASDLLLRTQRSAADIGMAVGYLSEAAFGKAFQQSTGETPGRYRRRPKA
ncbi:cupin domain-containing protein [Paraburkholderia flava]|uniref:cupin domain-containing protein n=1 Tax=Paraburkholderia flava TaxID=2547393 RepID=UPI001061FD5E|nr:AraC family transcriptional regulator [Paraburkholderia flava]